MARRPGSVAEREARDKVRDRYDAEVKAVGEFFGFAGQIDKLQDKIDAIAAKQADVVVRLADETGPARAAATVGWPISRVREAIINRTHPAMSVPARGSDDG